MLDALQQLGYHEESMQFINWLEDLCLRCEGELRIMYDVEGKPAPEEKSLHHLSGYRNSRPVRVGNGAASQTQIDIYGHVLDAVLLCFERMPRKLKPALSEFLCSLADRAASHWEQPDHGPWEVRGRKRHYLYSKLYCWVGLNRAIRFAEQHRRSGNIERWKEERAALREAIPLAGLLPIDDSRMQSTMKRVEEQLAVDGLVYRYRLDDSLPGSDAAFTLCNFWLVMNWALAGEISRARELFEYVCGFANDVGLLSEQIDPANNELLGNFPQGFTHLGLIRAALHLSEAEGKRRNSS